MCCCARRLVKAAPTDSSLKLARLASSNSDAIRAHFLELTTAVLMPFAPYCEAVAPLEEGPFDLEQQPPHLTPFSHAEFMDQLQASALAPPLQRCFRSQASMCFTDHPALLCGLCCAFCRTRFCRVLSYDVCCCAVLCCAVLCCAVLCCATHKERMCPAQLPAVCVLLDWHILISHSRWDEKLLQWVAQVMSMHAQDWLTCA